MDMGSTFTEAGVHIRSPPRGLLIRLALMVLEAILVFLGVVLVVVEVILVVLKV